MKTTNIQLNQIWKDRDPRRPHRLLRIIEITDTHAVCKSLEIDGGGQSIDSPRTTRILLTENISEPDIAICSEVAASEGESNSNAPSRHGGSQEEAGWYASTLEFTVDSLLVTEGEITPKMRTRAEKVTRKLMRILTFAGRVNDTLTFDEACRLYLSHTTSNRKASGIPFLIAIYNIFGTKSEYVCELGSVTRRVCSPEQNGQRIGIPLEYHFKLIAPKLATEAVGANSTTAEQIVDCTGS